MNDREMLELAAKAAGYEVLANKQAQRDEIGAGGAGLWIKGVSTCWNPRDDSAQAFELGIRLSFCQTQWFKHQPPEVMIGYKTHDGEGHNWIESHNGDPEAATRLAITRAAAEIGKSMP